MRKLYYDFLIDGKPILVPDEGVSIHVEAMEAEDSGKDESGFMHRFLLREKVHTFGLSYSLLTREEYQYMESLFAGKVNFQVKYRGIDDRPGELMAYRTGHSVSLYDAKRGIYREMQFELQEC